MLLFILLCYLKGYPLVNIPSIVSICLIFILYNVSDDSGGYQFSSSDHSVVHVSDDDSSFVKDEYDYPQSQSVHASFIDNRLESVNSNFDETSATVAVPTTPSPPPVLLQLLSHVPLSSPPLASSSSFSANMSNIMPTNQQSALYQPVQQTSRQSSYIVSIFLLQ